MHEIDNWQQYAVRQRHSDTGCIPTGYEMLLRAAKVPNIRLATFQDEFDLERQHPSAQTEANHFESVRNAVMAEYHHVNLKWKQFAVGDGDQKIAFIDEQIQSQRLVLVSLHPALLRGGAKYHITPAIKTDGENITVLNSVKPDGTYDLLEIEKEEIASVHKQHHPGGSEVAYLELGSNA